MALVLKLTSLDLIRLHRLGWCDPFQGLNAGHLITTYDMAAQRVQQRRVGIHGTDALDLLSKGDRISRFGLGIQPVAAAMRLQGSLILKSARPSGVRCWSQCHVWRLR